MTPPHLYPLCEDCDATICPSAAGFSCEHVCGASRVASEAPCGRASLNFPGASASGFFRSARFRSTQFFRARASSTTRSVAKLSRVHVSSEQRFFERNGVRFEEDISYDGFAVSAAEGEYSFVALRSGAALYEDGRAMHHCVGSYSPDVIARKSRIYSVRHNGKRVATIEFRRSRKSAWAVAQICGPCNARVAPEIKSACDALAKKFGVCPA